MPSRPKLRTFLAFILLELIVGGINLQTDTLSKAFAEKRAYDVVLANPPFNGAIDAADGLNGSGDRCVCNAGALNASFATGLVSRTGRCTA
jgi:hypothetical protein